MDHLSEDTLTQALSTAATLVTIGGTYVHYKDASHTYSVIGFGIWEKDETAAVIYKALYGKQLIFIRPLSSWTETITVEGKNIPRFRLITDTEYN